MQQAFAGDAGDDMAATANSFSTVAHIDGVPDDELIADLLIRLIVGPLKCCQCAVGEDDTPAIGDVGRIALYDSDVVRWIGFFDEQTAIETCRPSTKDYNVHFGSPGTRITW